jgi:ribosome maturation factor RimP
VGRAADLTRLREIVARAAVELGYDLEHLSVRRVGSRHLVRVMVDSDNRVDLDRVAELSRRISAALDAAEGDGNEIIPGEYDLEVGSPGTDRPLTAERHWRRNIGRLVRVRVAGRQVTGRIVAAAGGGVVLDVDGVATRYHLVDLGGGRIQVELNRPTGDPELDGALDGSDDLDGAGDGAFDGDLDEDDGGDDHPYGGDGDGADGDGGIDDEGDDAK